MSMSPSPTCLIPAPEPPPAMVIGGVSWAPPVLAVSVMTRPDGTLKDTLVNVRETGEFVVNLVSVDLRKAMEQTARSLPYGTDEAREGRDAFLEKREVAWRIRR